MKLTAEERREALAELKRTAFPRASVERLGLELDEALVLRLAANGIDLRAEIDRYLRGYTTGDCPLCGWGRFTWGIAHGAGYCAGPDCGWPGRLYHFVTDQRPEARCEECGRPRSAHDSLSCPAEPARGIRGMFRAPTLVRIEYLLWAHPYTVTYTKGR